MPQPLAVCDHCGHFFKSGTGFGAGGTGVEVTLTVENAPRICPRCGNVGHVLGGAYRIAGETIELLQGPERTVTELERLREILREARESGASAEEVGDTLQREFPGWGSALAKLLVPRTSEAVAAYIMLVLMALEMVLGDKQAGQTTNIAADQVINYVTVVQEAPPASGQKGVAPSTNPTLGKKIGRNEPCPCGSSKKFKKCHGKDGERRYYGP